MELDENSDEIKILNLMKDLKYIRVADVQGLLNCSYSKAYSILQRLTGTRIEKHQLVFYSRGLYSLNPEFVIKKEDDINANNRSKEKQETGETEEQGETEKETY